MLAITENDVSGPIVDHTGAADGVMPAGTPLFSRVWPGIDPRIQLRYGAELGLGSMEYELVEVG